MSQKKEINRREMAANYDYRLDKQDLKGDEDAGIAKDWFEPEADINSELEWFDISEIDIQFLAHQGE